MELERKTFQGYGIKALDDSQGVAEMVVSVFNNVDYGGDIVRPGFFDKAAANKLPKGVWAHDPTVIIAKTLETFPLIAGDVRLPEKIRGLGGQYVKAQFNLETQAGREAFSNLKGGYVDEFSFAYWVAPGGANYMENGTRELMVADSWPEWSPVLEGMNPATALISAKSADGDAAGDAGVPLSQDLERAVDAIERVAQRLKARHDLRVKEGRRLSAATVEKIQAAMQMLDELLDEALGEPEDEEPAEQDEGKAQADVLALKMRIAKARAELVVN